MTGFDNSCLVPTWGAHLDLENFGRFALKADSCLVALGFLCGRDGGAPKIEDLSNLVFTSFLVNLNNSFFNVVISKSFF